MVEHEITEAYKVGKSINSIARELNTYATSIRRILIRNNIELRHDAIKKGEFYVKDGDKLIAWAKAQGRLVTKTELAAVLNKKKLSPSYFEKYPELGKYVKNYNNNDINYHIKIVANWLNENHIPYKPSDRTKLKVTIDFLLLGEYSNIALQIFEKPSNVTQDTFNKRMSLKSIRAEKAGIKLIFLTKETIEDDLNSLKEELLNSIKS